VICFESLEQRLTLDAAGVPFNMVAWWDGTVDSGNSLAAVDIKTGNNGTLSGGAFATLTDAYIGSALKFDGVDDSFEASYDHDVYATEFWFRPENDITPSSSAQGLIGFHNGAAGQYEYITLGSATSAYSNEIISLNHDTGGRTGVIGGTISGGEWHHFAISWIGSRYDVYLDGVVQAVTQGDAPQHAQLFTSGDIVRLGDVFGARYAGMVDELTFYNQPISAGEIQTIFTAGAAGKNKSLVPVNVPSGAGGWWDGTIRPDSPTIATEILAGNHGTLLGGAASAAGLIGETLHFDGLDDAFEAPYSHDVYAAEFWFNPAASITPSSPPQDLVAFHVGAVGEYEYITLGASSSAYEGEIISLNHDGLIGWGRTAVIGGAISGGEWHHFAISWIGSRYDVYLDGVVQSVTQGEATNHAQLFTSGEFVRIGEAFGNYFAGEVDELTLYNQPITSIQVREIFTAGAAGKTKSPTDIGLSNASLPENQPAGTTIGTLSTVDPNPGDTFSYSLVSGTGSNDNASFAIFGIELRSNATFNYEAKSSYNIRVQSTDSGGLTFEKAFTIILSDVDEFDVSPIGDDDSAENEVAENSPVGTVVGFAAVATDADGTATVSYSLVNDAGGRFAINPTTGVVTVARALDYETATSHTITVRATSTDGSTSELPVILNVLDVQEGTVLHGTAGNDNFRFWPGPSLGQLYYSINNGPSSLISPNGSVTIAGNGGTDALKLDGTNLSNDFEIYSDRLGLNGILFYTNEIASRTINALGSGDIVRVFDGSAIIDGGSAADTLIAAGVTNHAWRLTGANSGTLDDSIQFTHIERLIGNDLEDLFDFGTNGSVSGHVDGGNGLNTFDYSNLATAATVNLNSGAASKTGGASNIERFVGSVGQDTLIGINTSNTWNVTGQGTGNINEVYQFTGFDNLTGGSLTDTFLLASGAGVTGNLSGGGGIDTVGYLNSANASVDLAAHTASQIGGTFSSIAEFDFGAGSDQVIGDNLARSWTLSGANSITVAGITFQNAEALIGGTATDTLIGPAQTNLWHLTGVNSGDIGSIHWQGMENLTGSTMVDTFAIQAGGSISGTLSGGGGVDILDFSNFSPGINVDLDGASATGIGHFTSIGTIHGTVGSDLIHGANNNNTWHVTTTGGTVDGIGFDGFENWQGGSAIDTLIGLDQANFWEITGSDSGQLDNVAFSAVENLTGGDSIDTFTFHNGGSVSGTVNGGAGADVLDLANVSAAATVDLSTNASTLTASLLSVSSLIGNGTNATLQGANNANIWNIASFTSGTVDTYNFAGFTNLLGGSAVDTFRAAQGITFLGQINGGMGSDRLDYAAFTSAVVANLATGQVTGFGSAIGIENATGGSGDDLLVGNNDSNLLSGGNGDDILFGLGGNDSLSGNTGRDILFGGTGSDIIHGNNTDDILVGGSTVFADELSGTVNQLALQAIRNEWKRLDTTYSLRIAHLDGTSSGGGEQFLLP
jgi:hypothetical protein